MTDKSLQETALRELSKHTFGRQLVFKPFLYGNSEEPADLVWHTGRCVVLVNATSGNKSLHSKRKHNQAQAHRWLRRWKQGEPLRGADVFIEYDDVDFIVSLSVVGGRDAASAIDLDQIEYAHSKGHSKVFAIATISDLVFLRLCLRSVGIRDLVHFIEFLIERKNLVSDADALSWIEDFEIRLSLDLKAQFDDIISENLINISWQRSIDLIRALTNGEEGRANPPTVLADLAMADVLWLSVAERSMALQIAPPGNYGPLVAVTKRRIGNYSIKVVVAAHLRKLKEHLVTVDEADALVLYSSLDLGATVPTKIILFHPHDPPRKLYEQLRNLGI